MYKHTTTPLCSVRTLGLLFGREETTAWLRTSCICSSLEKHTTITGFSPRESNCRRGIKTSFQKWKKTDNLTWVTIVLRHAHVCREKQKYKNKSGLDIELLKNLPIKGDGLRVLKVLIVSQNHFEILKSSLQQLTDS